MSLGNIVEISDYSVESLVFGYEYTKNVCLRTQDNCF